MATRKGWFEVDRNGLAEIAKRRGMPFVVTEPIQNGWDEAGVTEVSVELTPVPNSPTVDLVVRDDAPDGFRDLADSYMMFRTSYKLANPEQRGRFNVGEKLILATAIEARITSTKGSVIFGPNGRTTGRKTTESGSVLTARLRMTRAEMDEAIRFSKLLIPPEGIRTTINGTTLPVREPVGIGERSLETELRGEEGNFRYAVRKTEVRVYRALRGEEPMLYEMGIPIDKVACPWHVDVQQKVPLSLDRSSVRYGYVKAVETAAAEIMADAMTEESTRDGWVTDAIAKTDDDVVVRTLVEKRFGKAVIYDPSSPESNKLALDNGYTVVKGGELPKGAWNAVKRAEALQPAGRLFPSGKVESSPNGVPPVPHAEWDEAMKRFARYAENFAEKVLEGAVYRVDFYDDPLLPFNAVCAPGTGVLAFNLGGEMRTWIEEPWENRYSLDAVLIHECAHHYEGDHLTHAFHRACCLIGSRLRYFSEFPW